MDFLNQALQSVLLGMPIILFSLVFHEFGHASVARALGHRVVDEEARLSLDPRGHLDPLGSILLPIFGLAMGGFIFGWARPVEWIPNPSKNLRRDQLLVSAAGPAMNLVLLVVFTVFLRTLGPQEAGSVMALVWRLGYFGVVFNAVLIVFNLIPLPPLDGFKVLGGLLDPIRAARLRTMNPGLALGMLLLLIFSGALSIPIGFLVNAALTLAGYR